MPPLRRVLQNRCTVRSLPPGPAQRAMPRIVTRPVIDIIASVIRRSWRSVVGSRHWLKQAKTVIISGMGGGSSCKVGLGNPYSTRCCRSTHLHFYTVLSHPISSPFLAKVLLPCQAFDTRPECKVFAFDLLRLLFPNGMC